MRSAAAFRQAEAEPLIEPVVLPGRPEAGADAEATRTYAQSVLDFIGKEFARNRQANKARAFEIYQQRISENLDYLVVGGVMDLKEATKTIMELEEFRKQTTERAETPAQALARWLSGDDLEHAQADRGGRADTSGGRANISPKR